MIYTEYSSKPEMLRRVIGRAALLGTLLAVAGCATYNPLALFHRHEGGAATQPPPPAPGLNDPPPNLASVPPRPPPLPAALQRAVRHRLQEVNTSQNALPAPAGGVPPPAIAAPKPLPPPAPPLLVGFTPGNAILARNDRQAVKALAARRGAAEIAAIGFASRRSPAGLHLALLRATAIANELTRAGVPAASIRIEALAAGRGGAAQLLYPAQKP